MFKVVFTLLKKNGTSFTVKYLKQSRLLITRYLCGRPIHVNEHFISTRKGFPKKFLFLKKLIDSKKVENIRLCLTLMNLSKAIEPRKTDNIPIDLSTITKAGPEKFYTIPSWFVKRFINQFGLQFSRHTFTYYDQYLSLKAGPHGPTSITIAETVKFLTDQQLEWMSTLSSKDYIDGTVRDMRECVEEFKPTVPGSYESVLGEDGKTYPKYTSCKFSEHNCTGKLAIVHDAELKERVIAISDYYSQHLLKPIHNELMNNLRRFPMDRTYTQEPKHN